MTPLPPFPPMVTPMFEQPTLGLLMCALEELHKQKRYGFLGRKRSPRELRIPARMLICSLAEDGQRALTRAELQLIRQAVRVYLRRKPAAYEHLEAFLD